MSFAWSQPYQVAHVMRFATRSHWVALCGRYEIRPEDWRPWWEAHPGATRGPLRFQHDDRPAVRWCVLCDHRAADIVRELADLPSVRPLLGLEPCA